MTTHSTEYRNLLASSTWAAFSARIRRLGFCGACRAHVPSSALQTHHWHYERLGLEGAVDEWDVSALCGLCHPIADDHRQEIVRAAKAYASAGTDPHWRRAAKLLGEQYVRLLRHPYGYNHRAIVVAAFGFLRPRNGS